MILKLPKEEAREALLQAFGRKYPQHRKQLGSSDTELFVGSHCIEGEADFDGCDGEVEAHIPGPEFAKNLAGSAYRSTTRK